MYRRLLLLFASVYDLIIHQRGRRHRGAGQLRARVQGAGRAADHGRLHQRRRAFAPPVRRYEARATFLHACCGHAHAHARLPTPGMMITTHMAESSGLPSGERGLLRNPPVFWPPCRLGAALVPQLYKDTRAACDGRDVPHVLRKRPVEARRHRKSFVGRLSIILTLRASPHAPLIRWACGEANEIKRVATR